MPRYVIFTILLIALLPRYVHGQGKEKQKPAAPVLVATVGDEPIYAGQVAAALARISGQRKLAADDRPRLEAQMLEQLVNERVALAYLVRHDEAISRHHVDAVVEETKSKLAQRKQTLANYLREHGSTEAAFRTELTWRLSWQAYLERRVTDAVLKKYFESNRKHFDGTRVRVSHILLRPTADGSTNLAGGRAIRLRHDIVKGRITFAAAAEKHSEAPSKAKGGDIGFITRHGEMVEPFAAAAFKLIKDKVSPPVETKFGVHLILVTAIEPGKKTWTDVADQLRSEIIQRGFRRIVDTGNPRVKVNFTGAAPYFDPASGKLVVPK